MRALALICALAPVAGQAETLAETLATAPEITESAWREMTAGKTVVYQVYGMANGLEHYGSGQNVTFELEDGSCLDGTWYMKGTAFCFDWPGEGLNCFRHRQVGDDIYVVGLNSGGIQLVDRIDNTPLSCGPALLSALEPEARP
jgi:hypothetical protein